jgi:hypothetical protein
MAVITDISLLDRNQVVYNLKQEKVSTYPVGALVASPGANKATAAGNATTAAGITFTDTTGAFTTTPVAVGDILVIKSGNDAGHYVVKTVAATVLTLKTNSDATWIDFTGFVGETAVVVYEVHKDGSNTADQSGSGLATGVIRDGLTEQCLYSYSKGQWLADTMNGVTGYSDNTIRHVFPYEPITPEQFEIGGGASHDAWAYKDNYTRRKIRTAGWSEKILNGTTNKEWSGIITLGYLDTDTQVYFQQTSATTTPANLTFKGVVNEPIQTYNNPTDYRTYLKLFARKKGRSYAQSTIGDIGVSTMTYQAYRFPLAHATDTAITATDGQILGTSTFRGVRTIVTQKTDGVQVNGTAQFTSATGAFVAAGCAPGDSLQITAGGTVGTYTILTVDSATQITLASNFEFTTFGTASGVTFTVTTPYYFLTGTTRTAADGALANTTGVAGTLTSASSNFTTAGVAPNDLVLITSGAFTGVYTVNSVTSATVLTLNTTDLQFTTQSSVSFSVVKPGMYLQYMKTARTLSSFGTTYQFTGASKTLTRQSGSFSGDGVAIGDVFTITGTASNNGSFTVATVGTTTLTFIATDTIVNEGPTAIAGTSFTANAGFKRTINSVVYSFNWKLTGNGALAADCYQFIQHQLRQTGDIDWGVGTSRGDITDLLMSYTAPNGLTNNLHIDNLNSNDINNTVFKDASGGSRSYPYVAAGTINFNSNLSTDTSAKYTMFFTTTTGGQDFGTPLAIIVKDGSTADITGSVPQSPSGSSVSFTFDYDGNVQGGRTPGTTAAVTIVAIGTTTAQYVISTGTITRAKGINFSLVSALERTYKII